MAWIESHQSLRDHRKTKALRRVLKIKTPQAIGHLHLLWWWCLDNAPDGNLSDIPSEDLAEAAEWTGDPGKFVSALLDAGFIDRDTGQLHDWMDYSGGYLEQQRLTKEQKRAGGKARMAQLSPEERSKLGATAVKNRWSRREIPAEIPAEPKKIPATGPNRTNITNKTVPTEEDKEDIILPTIKKDGENVLSSSDENNDVSVFVVYRENIGELTPIIEDEIKEYQKFFSDDQIGEAIAEAVKQGIRTWKYITGILNNWQREGHQPSGDKRTAIAPASTSARAWTGETPLPPDPNAQAQWLAALAQLEQEVSKANYRTWLSKTSGLREFNGDFVVSVPNSFVANYLERNQCSLIEKALSGILNKSVRMRTYVLEMSNVP
jgi:DnaD/phage-associated family protein